MTMKALIIGGPRHGEWLTGLFDGTRTWVDIEHATSHVMRKLTCNVQDPATDAVNEAYVIYAAVHEQLQGPNEPTVVGQLLNMLAMNAYAREHGEAQEIPKEPSGASLVVPGKVDE